MKIEEITKVVTSGVKGETYFPATTLTARDTLTRLTEAIEDTWSLEDKKPQPGWGFKVTILVEVVD